MSVSDTLSTSEKSPEEKNPPAPDVARTSGSKPKGKPRRLPTGGEFLLQPVLGEVFSRELFSEEQREIESMVKSFAAERVAEQRDAIEKLDKEASLGLMKEAADLGLTSIDIPERFGGLELDKTTSALVVEALTRGGSSSLVVTFSCHVGIGTLPIVYFGTEEQKERFLPKLGSLEFLGAYALTEPERGSDIAELASTARPSEDGESFILNGTKQFITNGGWADLFTVFADLEGHGVTAFLVERATEGLGLGAEEHKLGIKGSSTVSMTMDDVRIPKENLLGKPGQGLPIALNVLNIGRFKLGAATLGGCKETVNDATQYALERIQFGQPIAYFEAIRKKLADMVVKTYLLDSAIYRTVGLMDGMISQLDHDDPSYNRKVMAALEEYAIEASISKVLGSETASHLADEGIQIYGGNGFSEEYPMAGRYRDTRIDRIYEGTNEINRMVIYGYFLKNVLTEALQLREAEKGWLDVPPPTDGPLAWEVAALDTLRRLTLKCLFEAVSLYGQDLRNAQVVGEDLADLAIGYFSGSAAINRLARVEKLDTTSRSLARLCLATVLEDAFRIFYRLRPVLFADAYGREQRDAFDGELAALHLPFDPVQDIHHLTDDLYDRGAYRFE